MFRNILRNILFPQQCFLVCGGLDNNYISKLKYELIGMAIFPRSFKKYSDKIQNITRAHKLRNARNELVGLNEAFPNLYA